MMSLVFLAIAPLAAALRCAPTQHVSRRSAVGAAVTFVAGVSSPALAAGPKPSDGKWAQRFDEFTDADFEGFSETPSGLKYKIFEEGYGIKPLAGQQIKAHYAGYLLNGAKFDASYDRTRPTHLAASFSL